MTSSDEIRSTRAVELCVGVLKTVKFLYIMKNGSLGLERRVLPQESFRDTNSRDTTGRLSPC